MEPSIAAACAYRIAEERNRTRRCPLCRRPVIGAVRVLGRREDGLVSPSRDAALGTGGKDHRVGGDGWPLSSSTRATPQSVLFDKYAARTLRDRANANVPFIPTAEARHKRRWAERDSNGARMRALPQPASRRSNTAARRAGALNCKLASAASAGHERRGEPTITAAVKI